MFVLTVAAAEAAVGLAILVTFFRNRGDIAVDDVDDEGLSGCRSLVTIIVRAAAGRGRRRPVRPPHRRHAPRRP